MKPFRIVFGIIGGSLIFLAVLAAKKQIDFSRDASEINSRLSDIRAMGYATNGDEYMRKIPDAENAWIEIGPMLVRYEGEKVIRPFTSRHSNELLNPFLESPSAPGP